MPLHSLLTLHLIYNYQFIGMVGLAVLIYCSSNNVAISQRLNLPTSLALSENSILVTQVTIDDISAYASLTDQAKDAQW
jgi:hypothetical protein